MFRLRNATYIFATVLAILAVSALMPASWVLAAPGDGYGPGTCGGDTTRACEATNSALTVAVEAILAAATGYSTGAGTVDATTLRSVLATNSPGAAVLSDIDPGGGTDTQATIALRLAKTGGSALVGAGGDGDPMPVSDDGGSLTVDNAYFATIDADTSYLPGIDADTSTLAGTVTTGRMAVNPIVGASGIYSNAGTTGVGSPRVTQAVKATADTLTSTDVAQAAGDTAILVTSPADSVIYGACCQNRDADGPIVVAQGATTAVGTLGARLDPAPWVGGSGGSACWEHYSGPLTGYTETVGATVTVSCWRW